MSSEIMQENTPFVECSAFHRGMSVLEASLRNTEDSEAITHCAPTSIALMENRHNKADQLTDFLQEVKERAHYHYWLFGHYHDNRAIDEKHILLWEQIVQII